MTVFKRVYEEKKGKRLLWQSIIQQKNTTFASPAEKLTASADHKELRGMLNGDLVRDKDKQYMMTIDRDESEILLCLVRNIWNKFLLFDQSRSGVAFFLCFF